MLKRWVTAKLIEDRTFMARVAEEAGMYEDMVVYLKDLLSTKENDFNVEERNLLSVSFKNWVNPERTAIKLVGDLSEHPKLQKFKENMKAYKTRLENEHKEKCNTIIELIEQQCLPLAVNSESKVFFLKMVGDYYRYQAEFIYVTPFSHLENRTLQEKKAHLMKTKILEKVERYY